MEYGGFWRRFGAFCVDTMVFVPIMVVTTYLSSTSRYFWVLYFIPGILIGLWFNVYLVKRYGGTPGKLLLKLRIRKLDGTPVGIKEAFLRHSVFLVLSIPPSLAYAIAALKMTDPEYLALTLKTRGLTLVANAPTWYRPADLLLQVWIWSEFVVLLTNKKRRALHDFLAGTIVLRQSQFKRLPSGDMVSQPD